MSFSTATGISLIDSRNKSGFLLLPSVTDIPGRILYIKDSARAFGSSSITLSTQLNQSFDNGRNTNTLKDTDGYILLASDGISKWTQIGGTTINEGYIGNAYISSLFANTMSTTYTTTTKSVSRSTFELNTQYRVGPSTISYRGRDLFTPLTMNMSLYDLPISTFANLNNSRVNILSTFTASGEFNIPIDFGAYPYTKNFYSTLTNNIGLPLNTRNLNMKLWGVGGNSGYIGTNAPPSGYLRGGAGAYMNVSGFYPSKIFGPYNDPISYALYVPDPDTTKNGAERQFVVSTVVKTLGQFDSLYIYSGRGAVHGPVFRLIYQGDNYDIFSPASGGGGLWRSNVLNGSVTRFNGGDAGSAALSNIQNVVWDPNISLATQSYGLGGGGAQIGACNLNGPGLAGVSLNNQKVYTYPWTDPTYTNGSVRIVSALDPTSQGDPDWIEAGGLVQQFGLGGAGNSIIGSGLAPNPLVVIEQPYDRLTSNLTFVGNGTFTSLITAPVTFRLTGPDGLFLSINGQTLINDWTIKNQMHGISTVMQINNGHDYNVNLAAFNATSINNKFQFEYYIEDLQTLGTEIVMSISSGVFFNNASTTFTSSVTARSIFTDTFQTNNFIGQNFQLVPSNVQATTPFYVASAATFADTLVVQGYLSVSRGVYTSSLNTSSLVFENTWPLSDRQEMKLYDSTLTLGNMEILTPVNIDRLVLGSTIQGLGSYGYLSTMLVGSLNFTSTVEGIGSSGYLSSLNMIGIWNFISTSGLTSTIGGLGSAGYVSSAVGLDFILQSTTRGLGTIRYISSTGLVSTVRGLGSSGYLSSGLGLAFILQSTTRGLGSLGYLSSAASFGDLGYISSTGLASTVDGLGTSGYISSFVTLSTISCGLTNISIDEASSIVFNAATREAGRFISSGRFGINTSSPLVTLDVDGSLFVRSTIYVSSAIVINKGVNVVANAALDISGIAVMGSLFVQSQGTFGTTVTAQSFATPSDKTLKKDIVTISSPMEIIGKTRGVEFKWLTGIHDYGYVAQEVEKYLPEAVLKQGSTLFVKYDVFVPFITESIKGLSSEIADIRGILSRNGLV